MPFIAANQALLRQQQSGMSLGFLPRSILSGYCPFGLVAFKSLAIRLFSRTEIRCLSAASYAARVEVRNSLARRRLTAIPCFAYRFSIFGKSTPASAVVALFCAASSPRGFLVLFCRHKKVHKRDIARNFLYNTHGIRTRRASSSENRLNIL